ncbi:MAG: GxxExxY protein [Bacteroidales bacterium]|nr:GxxExxY protein [Bacteroidales bacterium]
MTHAEQDKVAQEVVRCAREVYIALGHGFNEVVYTRALSVEMSLRNVDHQRNFRVPLFYKCVDVGQKRVDFLVEKEMPVEVTAFANLADSQIEQAMKYLESYDLETGLLINFGADILQFKRLFNEKF